MRVLVVCTFAITLVVTRAIAFAQAPVHGVGPDILGVRTGMAPQDVTKTIERQRPVRTCESTPHGSSYKLSCVARTMRDTTSGASSGSLEILVAKDLKASGLVIEVARQVFGGTVARTNKASWTGIANSTGRNAPRRRIISWGRSCHGILMNGAGWLL